MQRQNFFNLKIFSISFLVIYVVLCLFNIACNDRAYAFVYYRFLPNIEKIHAKLQVTTGPIHYLDDTKSKKILKEFYPKIGTYEIELIGDTPYKRVDDPAEIGDVTVYGKFNGVTDQYKAIGYGEIPVFDVKYYDNIDYFLDEVFSSPLVLFTIIILLCFIFILIKRVIIGISKFINH
ncbi:hypothetical protein M3201_03615 [Paenibacillus motobuensis]|uniref:hypothetical protein n=1 Tax=Paenibacillus TaxID=44249 RepID=UPI00203CE3AB|nr:MULTISPECIES: hypothetical protein [Paenibacillus]MCM3038788.1 hypothetical protein [Paenibacillus lutimineralis]MCM3645892.1 hypothetical protein [Paenibacillus motobuensis]